MNWKFWLNPWGYARELEQGLSDLIAVMEDDDITYRRIITYGKIIAAAAADFAVTFSALNDIVDACDAVASPNGTARKVRRIAAEHIELLTAKSVDLELSRRVRDKIKKNAAAPVETDEAQETPEVVE